MKFGKEFTAQLVHEWEDAYMDYNSLKKILKSILHFKKLNESQTMAETSVRGLRRSVSVYRAYSGLTSVSRVVSSRINPLDEVIFLNEVPEGEEVEGEPTFVIPIDDGGEYSELLFFEKLDKEFNKVLKFYKKKVGEALTEAEDLNKQMEAFVALRIKVETPFLRSTSCSIRSLTSIADSAAISEENSMQEDRQTEDDEHKQVDERTKQYTLAPVDVLNRVKITTDPHTLRSTFQAILPGSNPVLSLGKVELKKAEQRITHAFVEFHHKLRLLKRYSFLNQMAFSKIMKKHDKVTSKKKSKSYMDMVDKSDIGSSDVRYRINYPFVFGFKQGTEMGYRDVLLLGSGLAVLMLGGILANMNMEMDPETLSYEAITELVPLGILIFLLLVMFCPFNTIYRSSRIFFLTCAFHAFASPFFKVTLPDFFVADQFTSEVQAWRNLEFYICYYGWGDFKKRSNSCQQSDVYETFYYIVAIVPFWIRCLQSLRRMVDEKDKMQFFNAMKYFLTCVSVALNTAYELNKGTTIRIFAIVTSVVAVTVNTYWDLVIDWGLLRSDSKNRWLRDKLAVPHKSVYFVAMVMNGILRLAWMQTVVGFTALPILHNKVLVAIGSSLEVIRRGLWNFFRVENEHLNNVGHFRASKSVPLPFNIDDEDD
ncbi:hypothetical protein ACFE04_010241 [Oxalis oulophora]